MFDSYKAKQWLRLIRTHVCTLAVAVSFNSTWRVPRDAFRYGGLVYGLALTVAMATIALPVSLLQLAVGQLCQQDAVGMWRAVPFFRGVGYMRLLISFLGSIYTMVYLALTLTYFLYTTRNPVPFWECTDIVISMDGLESNIFNSSFYLNTTFMAPIAEQPQYYLSMSLIIAVLWIVLPFLLYDPVKIMRRIFYVLTPLIIILGIVIVAGVGDGTDILLFHTSSDWMMFLEPHVWHAAITQALWSAQIAGGYLVATSDNIYSNTDAQWSAIAVVGTNIVLSWAGSLLWFSISGRRDKDTSVVAVLIQVYAAADEKFLDTVWPLLTYATIFLSGIITAICLVYPVYERFRLMGGPRWRIMSFGYSICGASVAIAVLAGRLLALSLLDDLVVPLLMSITTILEICALIFIYGWKVLMEDVEFLTGRKLDSIWVLAWCAAPGVIAPFMLWSIITAFTNHSDWTEPPWEAPTIIAAAVLLLLIFMIFASVSVLRQVQFDFFGKLKSSFKPSRHWGPRDPISHYYWLARREDVNRGTLPRTLYHRRQLGQLSGRPSILQISGGPDTDQFTVDLKKRSNSDDWLYTMYRRQYLEKALSEFLAESRRQRRCKSLDWTKKNLFFELTEIGANRYGAQSDSVHKVKEDNNNDINKKIVTFASK